MNQSLSSIINLILLNQKRIRSKSVSPNSCLVSSDCLLSLHPEVSHSQMKFDKQVEIYVSRWFVIIELIASLVSKMIWFSYVSSSLTYKQKSKLFVTCRHLAQWKSPTSSFTMADFSQTTCSHSTSIAFIISR